MSEVKNRLLKGVGANSFGQIIRIFIQLVSVPVFLKFWDTELYGAWLTLAAIPAYLALSDIGFASVAANDMTMKVGQGDKEGANEVFQSIWALLSLITVVLALVAIPMGILYPFTDKLGITAISAQEGSLTLVLLGAFVMTKLHGGVASAGFRCDGNYAFGTFINNFIWLIENLTAFAAVFCGGGILGVALSLLVVRLLGTIISFIYLKKKSPWLMLSFKGARIEVVKKLFGPAVTFMLLPLSNSINIQGMTILVSMLSGATAVVVFSTVRTVVRMGIQFVSIINHSFWPEFSKSFGKDDNSELRTLHRVNYQMSIVVVGGMILFLLFTGPTIIRLWTMGKVEVDYLFFVLMLSTLALNTLWSTSSTILLAINKHGKYVFVLIFASIVAIAAASGLIMTIGINGAAISQIVLEVIMIIYVLPKVFRLLNENAYVFFKSLFNLSGIKIFCKH